LYPIARNGFVIVGRRPAGNRLNFRPKQGNGSGMSEAWSREEVEAAVADYFTMLAKELNGEPYSKAEHNRQLQNLLSDRIRGSVERKHQNISAVLIELGYPYIDGYKPLANYQELLARIVVERLSVESRLREIVSATVTAEVREQREIEADCTIVAAPAWQGRTGITWRSRRGTSRWDVRVRNWCSGSSMSVCGGPANTTWRTGSSTSHGLGATVWVMTSSPSR